MKITIQLIVMLAFQLTAFSQNIKYEYDEAGNRVERTIILKSATIPKDTSQVVVAAGLNEEDSVFDETLGEQEIRIYPNPTRGQLKVTISRLVQGEVARLHIYNISGALILQKENISTSNEINLSSQRPGIYIMRIVLGTRTSEWRIIKQ